MRRAPRRISSLAAAAALLLLAISPAALPGRVALAADRGLVVVAQTRYTALPEERRVHVTIDAVATSYTPNPPGSLAYYADVNFAVQAGATNVVASSGGRALHVALEAGDPDFLEVTVTFPNGIYFEESTAYRVAFDLPDPGGTPDRNFRISPSIVAFPVWAFGSSNESGGSVTVILPAGFRPSWTGEDLAASTGPNGEIVLASTSLPDPFAFFAYLSADRPGAFTDNKLTIDVGGKSAPLNIRAWEDDPDWGATTTGLMTDGLPALQRLIGLPYPAPGTLVVEEAATSRLGSYAGIYNNLTGMIRVRYDADAYVALHEAAHIWFNGDLFRDRWIGEAWAEFYGVQSAQAIGATGHAFDLTDDMLVNKIPLNDWGQIGAVEIGVEEYAYAATYHLATLIYARTNMPGLQAVWKGAHDGEMAYQPANPGETPQTGVDLHLEGWQQLLDLLDERTGTSFEDLWTEWVANPQDQQLMQARDLARRQYASVVEDAGAWNLPTDLRLAMGAWDFEAAGADMSLAGAVLDQRDEIEADAAHLDLTPPAELQQLFENKGGLKAAGAEADLQIEALAEIASASERLDKEESFLESIGLLGSDPEADLSAARDEFEADELNDAAASAQRASETRLGAESAGQTRALVGGGGIVLFAGATFVGVRLRGRRRARARAAPAPVAAPAAAPVAAPVAEAPAPEVDEPPAESLDPPA
jgi:hypothetical protein